MSQLSMLAKQLFQALWGSFRGPMLERKGDCFLAIAGLIWLFFRARSLKQIAYNDVVQLIAPVIWTLSAIFSWHVLKVTYSTVIKTPGWSQRFEVSILGLLLLSLPMWFFLLTYPSPDPNAPRSLTSKQKVALGTALSPYKGQQYAIDYAPDNAEVAKFTQDIEEALKAAGWVKISYGPLWAPGGFPVSFRFPKQFGVQWYIADRAPRKPVYKTLPTALRDCCEIVADGVRWPDRLMQMDTEIIYLYIGAKYQ